MDDDQLRDIRRREGKERAYRQLVDVHGPWMYRAAHRRLHHVEDALDAQQAALMKAGQQLDKVLGATSIRAYLLKMAKNAAVDVSRKQMRQRRIRDNFAAERDAAPAYHADAYDAGEQDLLDECMAKLPTTTRQAMEARYNEDTPWQDLADKFGVALDTIRQRVTRALVAVRDCLKGKGVTP